MHLTPHLENVEFKLGTLGSDLSFAKFKEKSTRLVNVISLCDLFLFCLPLNRGKWGTSQAPTVEARAWAWSPAPGGELAWSPGPGGNLRCSLNFLELPVPHLEDGGKNKRLHLFLYTSTHIHNYRGV